MTARTITLLYFAGLKDLLGRAEERVSLEEGTTTVAGLAEALTRLHPELEGRLGNVRFAVNETFVDAHASVEEGDVVALIPPVAGG